MLHWEEVSLWAPMVNTNPWPSLLPSSWLLLLLGFSVDSAMGIMSLGELTFVAGAPRANHTGAVVLLRKDNVYRLVPQHIFWGEELASSFGYSVATTDLNRDGWGVSLHDHDVDDGGRNIRFSEIKQKYRSVKILNWKWKFHHLDNSIIQSNYRWINILERFLWLFVLELIWVLCCLIYDNTSYL